MWYFLVVDYDDGFDVLYMFWMLVIMGFVLIEVILVKCWYEYVFGFDDFFDIGGCFGGVW